MKENAHEGAVEEEENIAETEDQEAEAEAEAEKEVEEEKGEKVVFRDFFRVGPSASKRF